jgi:hypothetical protein
MMGGMPRRTRLKVAIIESGRTQRSVALALDMGESRLSDIVTGMAQPRPSEEIGLSELLQRPRDWLFGEDTMAPANGSERVAATA